MESNENWENEEGTLVNEWYDEKSNDWRCRIHFDYDDRLMQDLSMSDLLLAESHSEDENVVLSIIRKEQWDKNTQSIVKDIDSADPTQVELLLTKTRDVFKSLTGGKSDSGKRIVIYAKKTDLGIKKDGDEYNVATSYQMMVLGGTVRILKPKMLDKIFNSDIDDEESFEVGELLGGKEVALKLDVRNMLTEHSGVFGYTGIGKSNMVSCLIDGLYKTNINDEDENGIERSYKPNVVVFDSVPEYSGLLVDLVAKNNNSMICFANQTSVPKKMRLFMEGKIGAEQAASDFVKNMLLPRDLRNKHIKMAYQKVYEEILSKKKVRFYSGKWKIQTIEQFNQWILGPFINIPRLEGSTSGDCINMQRDREKEAFGKNFTLENLIEYKEWYNTVPHSRPHAWIMWDHDMRLIDEYIRVLRFKPEPGYEINLDQLVDLLRDKEGNNLIIFQGNDDRSLQKLITGLISDHKGLCEKRALFGETDPLTLFVFDEAHKFIPAQRGGSKPVSSESVEKVCKEGRKFGVGALVSTQRMAHLDSEVVSAVHTYFVSKLPRKDDQEKVVDGFGMGRDVLRETFKFHRGDWLVLSNNGTTGLTNSPIHIHSYDANRRIIRYFSEERGWAI